jgi:hypothetical protein
MDCPMLRMFMTRAIRRFAMVMVVMMIMRHLRFWRGGRREGLRCEARRDQQGKGCDGGHDAAGGEQTLHRIPVIPLRVPMQWAAGMIPQEIHRSAIFMCSMLNLAIMASSSENCRSSTGIAMPFTPLKC